MPKPKLSNNNPYYNQVGSPICPLHPNLEGKIDDIYRIVTDIKLKMAKKEGEEESEEKHQQKEEKTVYDKRTRRERLIDVLLGGVGVFILIEVSRIISPYW